MGLATGNTKNRLEKLKQSRDLEMCKVNRFKKRDFMG